MTTIGAVAGSATWGFAYEPHRLRLERAVLHVSGLAPAFDGLRIALLTDVHHSSLVPADDVAAAVQLAMSEKPDLVVLGGDYVSFAEQAYVGPVAELLGTLTAPHGVFAILGNHDDERDTTTALTARRFAVLKDQRTRIERGGEAMEIAGIRFWTRRVDQIAKVLKGARDTVLLLAHDPRRLNEAASLNVPAVLSGHTHGGQVVIPGLGAMAKSRFPVIAGVGQRENTRVYVSRGIGTVYVPVRINCPPEVSLVTLRRQSAI